MAERSVTSLADLGKRSKRPSFSKQGRLDALKDLEDDVTAKGVNKCRDALWSTWCYAAGQWGIGPRPIQKDNVKKILAGLRAGGYRSVAAFLARAKQMHLLHVGAHVDVAVESWCTEYMRSAERGKGASALKDALDFTKIMEIDLRHSCLGKMMGFHCEGVAAVNPRALVIGGA